MRLALVALALTLSACNLRLSITSSSPATAAGADCLPLASDSGQSLPSAVDLAALATAAAPAPSVAPAVPSYFLHVPPDESTVQPAQVVVLLHGFGERGEDFARQFVPIADTNHWILAAPTITYTSLTDPVSTRDDDLRVSRELMAMLADVLHQRNGEPVRDRVVVVGFSRGASMAERFALLHPETVQAVAALSGGAYTLPQSCVTENGASEPLPLPLGTADFQDLTGAAFNADAFRQIPFWLGVGGADVQAVPSTYDSVLGQTRVARGAALQQAFDAFGVQSLFTVFPGIGHAVNAAMVSESSAFLAAHSGDVRP